jgi:ribosomal protein L16 Arg81 hydroxylase
MTITDDVCSETDATQASGELAAILDPFQPSTFFAEYWNQKALYIAGHPQKFEGLFDRDSFFRAAKHCADLKVGYTDEKGWPGHFNIDPSQIDEMLANGKTVCASVIDPGEPKLTAFLNDYRKSFRVAGKFSFNSYLSPDGAGFGLHLDHHPVVILQIEGRKRWWYSEQPGLNEVITNVSFPADRNVLKLPWVTVHRPTEDSLREVVLQPGDVLYLPKGCWHRAQALGHSLGLTLAMESLSLLDLIQATFLPKLNTVEFRNALPGCPAASGVSGLPEDLENVFASGLEKLRSLVNNLSPADLYAVWSRVEAHAQNVQLQAEKASAASRSGVFGEQRP